MGWFKEESNHPISIIYFNSILSPFTVYSNQHGKRQIQSGDLQHLDYGCLGKVGVSWYDV